MVTVGDSADVALTLWVQFKGFRWKCCMSANQ